MVELKLTCYSSLERSVIFDISTNIERFSKLLPKYFESLQITNSKNSELIKTTKI
jgi:hypothetical protein